MFFGKSKRIEELEKQAAELMNRNQQLESLFTPELHTIDSQKQKILEQQSQIDTLSQSVTSLDSKISTAQEELRSLEDQKQSKLRELRYLDDDLSAEEFGLYRPQYEFANSTQYKDALKDIRDKQKQKLKDINEEAKRTNWTVNNNLSKGRQMVTQTTKLLMRAYNDECQEIIGKVKFSNIERSLEQIRKAAASISKLGSVMDISVPDSYIQLKVKEAQLAYEYTVAKEKEKEEIRALKEQEREEKRVQKEIEDKRKLLRKEQKKYEQALADLREKMESSPANDLSAFKEKEQELISNLSEVEKGIEDVDYRAANMRAGYVYIISNVGSFGEDVYKIGMTRRLEPMERVRELGDASVPFGFDVHAMIFSDDAPALETALHHEFEDRKLNLVNQRREFFKCSIEEIKDAVIRNYDKTVEFVDFPDAEQWRTSEKMRLVR